ncbi:hypothetical protein pb186bvf_015864 [Paramecium bursaria]
MKNEKQFLALKYVISSCMITHLTNIFEVKLEQGLSQLNKSIMISNILQNPQGLRQIIYNWLSFQYKNMKVKQCFINSLIMIIIQILFYFIRPSGFLSQLSQIACVIEFFVMRSALGRCSTPNEEGHLFEIFNVPFLDRTGL